MRTASTVGRTPHGISKYLINIIPPILNKIKSKILNSKHSEIKLKNGQLTAKKYTNHTMCQLILHVPPDKAIQATTEFLQDEYINLTARTKSNLTDIHKLLQICLS